MARSRQKAKQRKAKRLAQEQKQTGQAPEREKPAKQAEPDAPESEGAEQRLEEIEEEGVGRQSMTGTGIAAEVELDQAKMDAELEKASEQEEAPEPEPPAKQPKAAKREKPAKDAKPVKRAKGDDSGKKKKKPQKQQPKGKAKPRERGRVVNFFRQVWAELKRVQWPTRDQVIQATGVVIGFVVVAGLYLGALDFVISKVVDAVF